MTLDAPPIQLEVRRRFAAPCERVYEVWTQPQYIGRWLGGSDINIADVTVDLRVGGKYRIRIAPPQMTPFFIIGEYLEVIPQEKLVYTWEFDNESPLESPTLVTVLFKEFDHQTEVILRHERFPTTEMRNQHEMGWEQCMDRVADILAQSQ